MIYLFLLLIINKATKTQKTQNLIFEMKIFILIVLLGIISIYIIKKCLEIKWIPVIVTEWDYFMNLKKLPYRIDFNHIILPSGESKTLVGKDLYIISGNTLKNQVLHDGRKISLEDGDCVVVDPEIHENKKPYKAFLVNPKGLDSTPGKNTKIRTSDQVTAEEVIIGAVIAKIPCSWIEKNRIVK